MLPVFAYEGMQYRVNRKATPLSKIDEIARLAAWPQGSCTVRWWHAKKGDGSWVCYSTSRIFGGPHHGKFMTAKFYRRWITDLRWEWEMRVVYAATRTLAEKRARKFWTERNRITRVRKVQR